jgi:antitoxin (DNA-binding transcriptional repressor) of toxin-antitoxin stability system
MITVTLEELQSNPLAVIERVESGESVVLTRADQPVAELRPLPTRQGKRPFGLAAGLFTVPDDINDPWPVCGLSTTR